MKTKFRKIATIALSLVLICTLAVSAFATVIFDSGEQTECGEVTFHTYVEGNADYAEARIVFDEVGPLTFDGKTILNYTYCVEDQVRPLYYQYGTKTQEFARYSDVKYATYTVSSGYIMIEATGKTQITQTINGVEYSTTTAPVTITLD